MKTNMLEYVKMILVKVSFNKMLFTKEYQKSLLWLGEQEAAELRNWMYSKGYFDMVNEIRNRQG
jgi:hypothetical protein